MSMGFCVLLCGPSIAADSCRVADRRLSKNRPSKHLNLNTILVGTTCMSGLSELYHIPPVAAGPSFVFNDDSGLYKPIIAIVPFAQKGNASFSQE